ncbi:Neuroguidin-A [Symbiodinium microadriaticum]|uniref:Neuroguidin-A n=1 Tax=Symbiodinium microadriaticum TaxID=2951 RepID=A0A1Q9ECK8_SYMMI|nr:Neuroguidin-A [Symbiodinium microadriaticum]
MVASKKPEAIARACEGSTVFPLIEFADDDQLASRGPAAYVEMKVQLLLSYLIALTYYLLLKVKGVPVQSHPVVPRLLWIRSLLEKLKPVDQRLQSPGAPDAHALRPGKLAMTVGDEEDEEAEEAPEEKQEEGVYKPPKIAQVEYTGDHVSMQAALLSKAAGGSRQQQLRRSYFAISARLERSEFMRSLREEFTDAPREILGEEKSARAAKAERLLQEQQEYEEDTMTRIRVKKADLRKQRQALREGRQTSGGAVSLYDASADFNDILRSADRGRGRRPSRGGGVLKEYEDAKRRAQGVRANVATALDTAPGKRKRGGGSMRGRARRR